MSKIPFRVEETDLPNRLTESVSHGWYKDWYRIGIFFSQDVEFIVRIADLKLEVWNESYMLKHLMKDEFDAAG